MFDCTLFFFNLPFLPKHFAAEAHKRFLTASVWMSIARTNIVVLNCLEDKNVGWASAKYLRTLLPKAVNQA